MTCQSESVSAKIWQIPWKPLTSLLSLCPIQAGSGNIEDYKINRIASAARPSYHPRAVAIEHSGVRFLTRDQQHRGRISIPFMKSQPNTMLFEGNVFNHSLRKCISDAPPPTSRKMVPDFIQSHPFRLFQQLNFHVPYGIVAKRNTHIPPKWLHVSADVRAQPVRIS